MSTSRELQMAITLKKSKKRIKQELDRIIYRNKQKIFCIGRNKTGTTSLAKAMKDLGFKVGKQREAEALLDDWVKRDFSSIISYCMRSEFFQDVPFSLPYTYIALDQAFPGSKFILTIRDNPDQWYSSLINFHGKLWGNGNIPPKVEDLKKAIDPVTGTVYNKFKKIMNIPDEILYNKKIYIEHYMWHNKMVIDYFWHRKNDLLVLNVSENCAYQKLCAFLNVKSDKVDFPWENKTGDTKNIENIKK
jgi:hypothetical protein